MPADLSNEEARRMSIAMPTLLMSIARAKREARATLLASLVEKVEGLEKCYQSGEVVIRKFTEGRATPDLISRADVLTLLRTEAEADG